MDKLDELFEKAVDAAEWYRTEKMHKLDGFAKEALGYKQGLVTAYALFTGIDEETINEDIQNALVERHERRIAEERG